ncbi:MAG: 3-deoxy-manno-octulosonate cytidylyltransferase (EC [uncultured Sulfurovum sp.]|uniref:3-deoxy-manno-octulosonate cytidylyltransferase n=1 Tax=uncultured Sulfurovum sp. TaxID=269237 RepID=A0A6S6TZ52_9BACT|nr:MAG: 3-deoxy-manno-octulosonate cytidylyltransferase (EC [uncultured Sulfurovum sp.]
MYLYKALLAKIFLLNFKESHMIIIPARIGSSRFPNKVLADVNGLPMVIRTAKAVENIDKVAIATDSKEVVEIAKSYGITAIMTSSTHNSGTDRIFEASQKLNLDDNEIIINVQADEPFIEQEVVKAVYDLTLQNRDNQQIMMNSCYKMMSNPEADDPNIVKLITNNKQEALYFSRAKIPYPRDHHFDDYKGHLGIYGFTKKSLKAFCTLSPAPLEEIEKLEQLRALYYGFTIAMIEVETISFGIDTIEDLEKALSMNC